MSPTTKPIINWEALQNLIQPPMPDQGSGGPNWDRVAPMYNMMAEMERSYTYNQINCFDTNAGDTVLDIGCGPGRIACIMAERAKSVTALDMYPKMLEYCSANAAARGLLNVTPRLLNWHNAELGKNIEQHDIVIASRSVGMWDIRKLNAFAKKYAVLVCWANAPSIPPILNELFAGTSAEVPGKGRPSGWREDRRVGYNAVWNMVYDLGADPNIRIVTDGFTKDFGSYEEAYDWLRQLMPFEDQYLPVFQENLNPYLAQTKDGIVTFRRETKTYVLWWKPVLLPLDD